MSFRWFIYYCALFGGWAALLGWLLGRWLAPETPLVIQASVKGVFLGLTVALALGLVDALWVLTMRQAGQVALRAGTAVLVGCLGGWFGGLLGQAFFGWTDFSVFLVLGWTFTGLLIGLSIGVFEALSSLLRREDWTGARRKLLNGLLGGAVGGLLGGILSMALRGLWKMLFAARPQELLWSPSAIGFVVLGICIGLLIGLAQVVFREAWVRVEVGFRAGRELLLSKNETTIGRAESCDIGLFGDPGVDPRHACIQLQGGRYVLIDAGGSSGTYLNEARITQPSPLRSGDLIRVGRNVLRFGERSQRRAD
ncbi:MAG TPA: FHA domain-containing protein [Gemmataceae bacterium]|nr:FHA domain-containing protein [Gemmataceae bacterium]